MRKIENTNLHENVEWHGGKEAEVLLATRRDDALFGRRFRIELCAFDAYAQRVNSVV